MVLGSPSLPACGPAKGSHGGLSHTYFPKGVDMVQNTGEEMAGSVLKKLNIALCYFMDVKPAPALRTFSSLHSIMRQQNLEVG